MMEIAMIDAGKIKQQKVREPGGSVHRASWTHEWDNGGTEDLRIYFRPDSNQFVTICRVRGKKHRREEALNHTAFRTAASSVLACMDLYELANLLSDGTIPVSDSVEALRKKFGNPEASGAE
jgi:hypothetical protein